ncbi:MAG: hypothetical protein WD225_09660, partial [Ilumatobacteraceae bacterium]
MDRRDTPDAAESDASHAWRDLGRALVVAHLPDESGAAERLPAGTVDEVRDRFHASLGEPLPFSILVANSGVPPEAAEVLAVALACETDTAVVRLLAAADPSRPRLTVGHVIDIDGERGARALGPDAALRAAALVDVVEEGAFVDHRVVVPPALTWALLGDPSVDPELPADADEVVAEEMVADEMVDADFDDSAGAGLVVVSGGDRALRRHHGARRGAGERFLAVAAPTSDVGWAAVVRDATITGRGVIVEVDERLGDLGRRWIERADHLTWVISSRTAPAIAELPRRPWVEVAVTPREVSDREWRAALGDVGRTHRLTHDQLATVERVMPAVGGDLDAAVRRLVSGRMEQLARRIRPTRH